MVRMNIGIMGGTFDPIHVGHLLAAEWTREELGLDEVWFIPVNEPPHKPGSLTSVRHRWEMVARAVKDHPFFKALDIEIRRGGTSYTYDTMKALKTMHPEKFFHFIIGADMVRFLPQWNKIHQLLDYCSFVGIQRPGFCIQWEQISDDIKSKITMLTMPMVDISSTEIRERKKAGKSIRYLVHDEVYRYIEENRLYES